MFESGRNLNHHPIILVIYFADKSGNTYLLKESKVMFVNV